MYSQWVTFLLAQERPCEKVIDFVSFFVVEDVASRRSSGGWKPNSSPLTFQKRRHRDL